MSEFDLDIDLNKQDQQRDSKPEKSLNREFLTEPVFQLLFLMISISFAGWALSGRLPVHIDFLLTEPITDPWYSSILATYAHIDMAHLLNNTVLILICGALISLAGTTQTRFHLFFLTTGVLSSVVQVTVTSFAGNPTAVIGASGGGFALLGYLLVANPVSLPLLRGAGLRILLLVVAVVSIIVTIRLSGPNSALLSHFTGVALGMTGGRLRILDSSSTLIGE